MSPTRKRSSAFDDFPVEDSASQGKNSKLRRSPAPPAAAPALPANAPALPVERIERLRPSQMLPDRFQPRHLLPGPLRRAFFTGQLDCYQAAAEWLALADADEVYRAEVERLLAMGGSFETHGQIKPITGAWQALTDGRYIFVIETGERRFWAACLRAVRDPTGMLRDQLPDEPLLRVEAVAQPSRQRQVLENRHAEPPSAVGQACEVAALILAELGIPPDEGAADEFDYFRRARAQRMPHGLWERVAPVMQLTRPRMVQLLNILDLPTPLLELSERWRLPERVLREVLSLPPAEREAVLRLAARQGLTSDEVAELTINAPAPAAERPPSLPTSPERVAASALRRFTRAARRCQALDPIADDLLVSGQAEAVLEMMDELGELLRARLQRR